MDIGWKMAMDGDATVCFQFKNLDSRIENWAEEC